MSVIKQSDPVLDVVIANGFLDPATAEDIREEHERSGKTVRDILVDGGTGILVPSRDPQGIAEAVIALAGDPERRCGMGEMARAMVVPAYGLDRMVDKIEALYEELIREKQIDA